MGSIEEDKKVTAE
jgi:hypothetical protein